MIIGDELEKARMAVKAVMALYIGGMGARGKNFYNDLAKRLGYDEAAVRSRTSSSPARRARRRQRCPDALLDAVHLVGPAAQIRDRLGAWKDASRKGWVDTMQVATSQPAALALLAEELL